MAQKLRINNELLMRPVEMSDVTFLKELYQYSDIRQYCSIFPEQLEDLSKLIKDILSTEWNWGFIVENNENSPIGFFCCWVASVFSMGDQHLYGLWSSYCMHPNYRRHGYATTVLKVLTQSPPHPDIQYAALLIEDDNIASQHVAINSGYKKTKMQGGRRPDGTIATEALWLKKIV